MREISPATNLGVDEFLNLATPKVQNFVSEIRRQKELGNRQRPSSTLIDRSTILTEAARAELLDAVATLVDENLFGRSEMCKQFADLLQRGLAHLDVKAKTVAGEAIYYSDSGKELFRWEHSWVRIGSEVVDGNVDSIYENPMVPQILRIDPYWGPVHDTPRDRKLRAQVRVLQTESDEDVLNIWWPELQAMLDAEFKS